MISTFRKNITLLLLLLCIPAAALAQQDYVFSPAADSVQIHIQGGQFATVYETRILNLQQGLNEVLMHGLPHPTSISDLQFGGDLMPAGSALRIEAGTMSALLGRLIGEEVTVSGPAGTITGIIEDAARGMLTLRDAEGQQVIVPNPHLYSLQTRNQDADIRADSGLMLTFAAERAGTYVVRLWYHTGYLGWSAEHQLVVDSETDQLGWTTLIHLENNTGADWEAARLSISSGSVNRRGGMGGLTSAVANDRSPDRFTFAFDEPVSLSTLHKTRLRFLSAENLPYTKDYHYRAAYSRSVNVTDRRPDIFYSIRASDLMQHVHSGANRLPEGETRLLLRTADGLVLIGDRAPTGLAEADSLLRIQGGRSPRLSIDEVVQITTPEEDENRHRVSGAYTIRNLGTEVKPLRISIQADERTRVISVSERSWNQTDQALEIILELQPGETRRVEFETEQRRGF